MAINISSLIIVGAVIGFVGGIGFNIWMFIYLYKKRYEGNLLKGTIEMINKLDSIKEKLEGGNMEDVKRLAKYLGKKIDTAVEDIKESIDALEMSILEKEEEAEEAEEKDEFSDLEEAEEKDDEIEDNPDDFEDDYKGKRKVSTKKEEKEDDELAQLDDAEEEEKPKKKGLFGKKKKREE